MQLTLKNENQTEFESNIILNNRFSIIRRLLNVKGAVIGLSVLLFWLIIIIFASQIAPYDPVENVAMARQNPSSEFLFGTDLLGRDILSRVIHGSRISLMLGAISVIIGAIPGILLGLISGYFGNKIDTIIMRFLDALLAFPGILLALVIIAAIGPSIQNVMIAVGISTLPQYARLTRGSVLTLKESAFVEAARVTGCKSWRIIFVHILPNCVAPLIILSTLRVGNAILVGSGLSFLGMGAQPPTAEWGLMAATGRQVIDQAWWISTFPGLAILSVVLAFNLIGDGLRSALDPKLKIQ